MYYCKWNKYIVLPRYPILWCLVLLSCLSYHILGDLSWRFCCCLLPAICWRCKVAAAMGSSRKRGFCCTRRIRWVSRIATAFRTLFDLIIQEAAGMIETLQAASVCSPEASTIILWLLILASSSEYKESNFFGFETFDRSAGAIRPIFCMITFFLSRRFFCPLLRDRLLLLSATSRPPSGINNPKNYETVKIIAKKKIVFTYFFGFLMLWEFIIPFNLYNVADNFRFWITIWIKCTVLVWVRKGFAFGILKVKSKAKNNICCVCCCCFVFCWNYYY